MAKINGDWERIEAIIRRAGMTTNYFAKYIGLSCGENLYRIKRGDNGISRDVAERIINKFPDISKGWLLTGEGSMLRDVSGLKIPFYNGNMHDVLLGVPSVPAYHILIPYLSGCDLAVKYSLNESEADGDNITLLLQRKRSDELVLGKIYVFTNLEGALVRKWDGSTDAASLAERAKTIYLVRGRVVLND